MGIGKRAEAIHTLRNIDACSSCIEKIVSYLMSATATGCRTGFSFLDESQGGS
jgi:hypothetical protein